MKIIVFGASGFTGTMLVRQAREQGLTVTAFVRDSSNLSTLPTAEIWRGDVRASADVAAAIAGHDAVLVALGSRTLRRSDLLKCGSANIVAAMREHGVRRLIVLGAAGSLPGAARDQPPGGRVFFSILTGTLLRNVMEDQAAMEEQVARSDLDFTIVRPGRLTGGPPTGIYRVGTEALPPRWKPISRGDVAAFMLKQLADPAFIRRGVYISR